MNEDTLEQAIKLHHKITAIEKIINEIGRHISWSASISEELDDEEKKEFLAIVIAKLELKMNQNKKGFGAL